MIPKYEEIQVPILKELSTGITLRAKDLHAPLAKHFGLTQNEINAWYPSGNRQIFLDRISWALSYLFIAGLIEKPQRGDYQISKKGLSMLAECTEEQIKQFVKASVFERLQKKKPKYPETNDSHSSSIENDDERTPEEALSDSYNRIKQNIQSQILTTILSKHPQEFERLVVKLLQAMGYGGEVKNSGIVTKLSNDGGIDGTIKEDILGFNHISIQAKRYALDNTVGRAELQSFVGAVSVTPSKKGVFITTSDYTPRAIEYVGNLNGTPTIILINGQQLVEYIYDYGLGLQTEKVLKIMKMDMDYWDNMDNA
ncbi:MAG: restriction endonuclease [Porphyromonas sp.]|nr:restriction endonuclease [Porphyromonas sp.]